MMKLHRTATNSYVMATLQTPGFHRWPGAPPNRAYLANRHRHMFHVKLTTRVEHDDRDIEFHDLQDWLREALKPNVEFGALSCEAIARWTLDLFITEFGDREAYCEVWEDGENGALVTHEITKG